ncbi:hypothetical protein KP806_02930 [Paenibacillus sp. N4]|uniref:hypothetical protein n=1 Tax=Paenibacillus vietnamensis TaxID=2590547 RepID=UPI001CD098A9|nr:hypothetical protein [Paenibacillus vietnamensis]MCA0753983.1 hypothetical protein [Paenibacillus vietnamensis]
MKNKQLLLFESMFCWMGVVLLFGDYMLILITNLRLIDMSMRLDLVWASYVYRIVLIPLLVTWCIELVYSVKSFQAKLILSALFIALLTTVEFAADWLQIFHHRAPWKPWWSVTAWSLLLIAVFCLKGFIRHLIKKDLRA